MFSTLVFSIAVLSELASAGIVPGFPTLLHLTQGGASSNQCLTASSNNDNAAVTIEPCTSSAGQQWEFGPGAPGAGVSAPGTLTVFGNKCLDVTNGVDADGTKLQIFTCFAGNTNQQWVVNASGTPVSNIRWSGHTRCVDNTNGVTTNGNQAQVWDCVNNGNQQWIPQALPGVLPAGTPTQFSHGGTNCFSATVPQNNEAVTIQPCSSNIHTNTWVYNSQKQLTIAGFCLDVTNGVNADGTLLQIFQCFDDNTNQKWNLLSNSSINWAGTNKCVDLTNGVTTPGNQLQVFTCFNGNTNQEWAETPQFLQ